MYSHSSGNSVGAYIPTHPPSTSHTHQACRLTPKSLHLTIESRGVQVLQRRRIPSSTLTDPLMRIFDEFDRDRDGHLSAAELAAALRSRKVDISEEVVQQFIEGA